MKMLASLLCQRLLRSMSLPTLMIASSSRKIHENVPVNKKFNRDTCFETNFNDAVCQIACLNDLIGSLFAEFFLNSFSAY